MAITKINVSTDKVSNLCTNFNALCDAVYTGATSNGFTLTLNKYDGSSTSVALNTYKQRGLSGVFGTATTISCSEVSANSIITATWIGVTGTPGVIWIDNIDPGVSFDVCTTSAPASGNIAWVCHS